MHNCLQRRHLRLLQIDRLKPALHRAGRERAGAAIAVGQRGAQLVGPFGRLGWKEFKADRESGALGMGGIHAALLLVAMEAFD
mgnify:CR=1 FL=1